MISATRLQLLQVSDSTELLYLRIPQVYINLHQECSRILKVKLLLFIYVFFYASSSEAEGWLIWILLRQRNVT